MELSISTASPGHQSPYGMPVVRVGSKMTTQNGDIILTGKAEVQLPY